MDGKLEILGLKLNKILTEIRYNRSFLFDDLKLLNQISKSLRPVFKDAQRDDQNNALVLVNDKPRAFSVVQAERASVDMDKPLNFNIFKEIANSVIEQLAINLDVEEYSRTGLRLFFGLPIKSVEQGHQLLNKFVFNRFKEKVNGEILSPRIAFTIKTENDFFINVAVAVESNFSVEIAEGVSSHSQEYNLLFDLDVYTNRLITKDEFATFIEDAQNLALENVENIFTLFKEDIE